MLRMSIRHNSYEEIIQNFIPRIKFGFSLMTISVHGFLEFVNKIHSRDAGYVTDYLDFNDIDWATLIKNSKENDVEAINDTIEGGKSILQVCIENEDSKS